MIAFLKKVFGRVNGLTLTERIKVRFNPFLIPTTYDGGKTLILKDRRSLTARSGTIDNENETTSWVEYWDGTILVHRSVHVRLKKMPQFVEAQQGGF